MNPPNNRVTTPVLGVELLRFDSGAGVGPLFLVRDTINYASEVTLLNSSPLYESTHHKN
jgi:hypothetical protein